MSVQPDLFGITDDLPAAAESLAETPGRWPRQLTEWLDCIERELTRSDAPLEPLQARALACRLVVALAMHFGGTLVYLPKSDSVERVLLDLLIWSRHDGSVESTNQLARELRVSANRIYVGLRRVSAWRRSETQPDLFKGD